MPFYIAQYEKNKNEVITMEEINVTLGEMQLLMHVDKNDPMYGDFPINMSQGEYLTKAMGYTFDFNLYEYHLCFHADWFLIKYILI